MNSCHGVMINGVQQMGLCDYLDMAMFGIGFLGFCFLLWGFMRAWGSLGLETASAVIGSEQGVQTFKKSRKVSYWLMGVGAIMLGIAIMMAYTIPN